jgi:hypothetical protein
MRTADPTREPNDAKLRELILYIARRSERDERFGATKLNKLLFFADFLAYVKLGSSITGQEYQKLPNGPAPRRLLPITKQMESSREFAWADRNYHGRAQRVPVALREPDFGGFSADEIAVVAEVLQTHWDKNARGVSDLSHQFRGWQLAEEGESIPYQMALVQFAKPRRKDVEKALRAKDEIAALKRELSATND